MRTIKVNPLSTKSIQNAITELENYKAMLKRFPTEYTRALSEYFAKTLGEQAPKMAQHWIFNISETEGKCTGVFIFDGICQFVEFGSGYIGMIQHEGINTEWLSKLPPPYNQGYNVGTINPRTGVSYIRNQDNPPESYWVYEKDGQHYSTQGQPADPFIYRSVQELLDARASIAKQLISGMGV